jgi:hypothetical protein
MDNQKNKRCTFFKTHLPLNAYSLKLSIPFGIVNMKWEITVLLYPIYIKDRAILPRVDFQIV